jgi:hypothetical protein
MMPIDPHTSLRIAFNTCVRREPHPQACTPPGFEWIPGYLNQHGGLMTDYARNWLLDKWEEPYRAALTSADKEYEDCLQAGITDTKKQTGLQLRLTSKLDARRSVSESKPGMALSTQVNVRFSPTGQTYKPCDPFDPNFDPDNPVYPVDPNAQPVSLPLSTFWMGATATYDLDALEQAMRPVNSIMNPDNPLSLRDLQLDSEGVQSAVRITGHRLLPIPAGVVVIDDLQTEIEVLAIRLDFSSELAMNGAVLDTWSITGSTAAYVDFYCYYVDCSWWLPTMPAHDLLELVPRNCIEDFVFRALPSATTLIRVLAGDGRLLDTITLSINHTGTIDSRPILARHRVINSPGTPLVIAQQVNVGPAALGEEVEAVVTLPACIAGKVQIAPDSIQDYIKFPQDNVIGVRVVAGATPETIKLLLTRLSGIYHWDRDLDIRLVPMDIDIGFPLSGSWPHLMARVAISWDGCDAFLPDRDSQARAVIESWSVVETYFGQVMWNHYLTLRVVDHAAPCDAFGCIWGVIRVTWPNGTVQSKQYMCVEGDIDVPRVFTLRLATASPPSVNVELELNYDSANRRRRANGTGFDHLPVPGPVRRYQTLSP